MAGIRDMMFLGGGRHGDRVGVVQDVVIQDAVDVAVEGRLPVWRRDM